MITKNFAKRRYYDMRLGGVMVSPIIQMANFTMIAFMWINHIIPIEVFAPIFVISGVILFSFIGSRFRKHQASTDYNMIYERQTEQAKTFLVMLKAMQTLFHRDTEEYKTLQDRIDYHSKIVLSD